MNVTVQGRTRHYRTVSFDAKTSSVMLIEQRLLPHHFKIVAMADYRQTAGAIAQMVVRGAGAIGATAAYGLAQAARAFRGSDLEKFSRHIQSAWTILKDARPTAVDPVNAMAAVRQAMAAGQTVQEQQSLALAAAEQFANDDVHHCAAIGLHGEKLIRPGARILTHCNAGWLAFVDVGTATAPLYAAQKAGKKFHVFCDETRPRCQGSTLTAWELGQQKISHEIISDNAAGYLMQRGEVDLVIVGSDRTLGRTGEVANKIGTYTKAVLAHRHGIPFYVAIPFSTIDWTLRSGLDIPIEERDQSEVLGAWGLALFGRTRLQPGRPFSASPRLRVSASSPGRARQSEPLGAWGLAQPESSRKPSRDGSFLTYIRIANPQSAARNPGFDVTPPELITGIITPLGIFKPRELWNNRRTLNASTVDQS